MMTKQVKQRQIKKNLTYTIIEAAEKPDKSNAIIHNWIKQILPVQKSKYLYQFFGSNMRDFIMRKIKVSLSSLHAREPNCFSCKAGRWPFKSTFVNSSHAANAGYLSGVYSVCGITCTCSISKAQMHIFSEIIMIKLNDRARTLREAA
jgi:hypothetical protein